jgi:hypothetical protein
MLSSFESIRGISLLIFTLSVSILLLAMVANGTEGQNNTNGSRLGNLTNSTASNTSSAAMNPTGSNIPCIAGNSCM